MTQRQISLSDEPIEKNKEFMRGLFSLTLDQQYASFDRLPYNAARRIEDPDMNLETFLANMKNPFVKLNLEREETPGHLYITYFVRGVELPNSRDERFAHWSVPYNAENYTQVAELFNTTYGRPIE